MGKTENGIVARSEESMTLMTPSRFPHHGSRFFAIALGNVFRSSSSCRFLFPIDNDALSQNRHSERRQECLVGKTENGTMKRSEESIMLMMPYDFPHYGNRSFAAAQDDALTSYTRIIS